MDKQIYISVYKDEQEALDAVNKLYRQGFRRNQVSVMAHNEERFHRLYQDAAVPMSESDAQAADQMDIDLKPAEAPGPVIPVVGPDLSGSHVAAPYVAAMPAGGLAALNLGGEMMTEYERNLEAGDILVILQTDEGQTYHPDMPQKISEEQAAKRQTL